MRIDEADGEQAKRRAADAPRPYVSGRGDSGAHVVDDRFVALPVTGTLHRRDEQIELAERAMLDAVRVLLERAVRGRAEGERETLVPGGVCPLVRRGVVVQLDQL